MFVQALQFIAIPAASVFVLWKSWQRLQLSRAKHPSLRGHARLSRLMAGLVPSYEYGEEGFYNCDNAPAEVADRRETGFARLAERLQGNSGNTLAGTAALLPDVSDLQFTNANRVPFQFRRQVSKSLPTGSLVAATAGVQIQDLDGNWAFDVGGSYGVNLFGYEFYKRCIERGVARVADLGPVLGPYHPLIADNVGMIMSISGQDEVSFHMSGTEAVMQAVRLARFHTRRRQLVLFCGAYHGWWDGVQAGVGHRRSLGDMYMLGDMSERSLAVLRSRRDIACVLVNPLQALHPNAGASSDAMLVNSERHASFDRQAYTDWLKALRQVCTARGIVLIFDEVFVGFRLGLGGAQAYFGVHADMVTYGKTIGGGLPVGVLSGRADLMKRTREHRPADVCFARGTFNSHPYVMASMNEFLRHVTRPDVANELARAETCWNSRIERLNGILQHRDLPVRLSNMLSICIVTYTVVSRYNWMFQYYLRAEGLSLGWIGTARLIFSHDYTDADFDEVAARFARAAEAMQNDGWWFRNESVCNRSIRREVLGEILANRFSWLAQLRPGVRASAGDLDRGRLAGHGSWGRSARPASGTTATSNRSESR